MNLLWNLLLIAAFTSVVLSYGGDDDFANEISPRVSSGSCAAAGLCCPGRDSLCAVQKAPLNAIIEDLEDVPCFCDHACLDVGDCCPDYKSACGVQDCKVSDWGTWSECDKDCGIGAMTRTRQIAIPPRHGGKACPPLVQKRGCKGFRCHQPQSRLIAEDFAVILPVSYSTKRKINETTDITKNLRQRHPKHIARERSKPYCVEFHVLRSTRACKQLEDLDGLFEGNRICVICEREAQRPYLGYKCAGTESERGFPTRFSSLKEPACHGKWKKVQSDLICACSEGARYIFV